MGLRNRLHSSPLRAFFAGLLVVVSFFLSTAEGFWTRLLILIPGVSIAAILVLYENVKPRVSISEILRLMVYSLYGRASASRYRSSVLLWSDKDQKLSIKYSYNMEGNIDSRLQLKRGQGCAGKAFRDQRPFVVNLDEQQHQDFDVDPKTIWKKMKAIACVPIYSQGENSYIIGILGIDTELSMEQARLLDTDIHNIMGSYAGLISHVIS